MARTLPFFSRPWEKRKEGAERGKGGNEGKFPLSPSLTVISRFVKKDEWKRGEISSPTPRRHRRREKRVRHAR